ncbi:bifunctional RNase H/acid phosphatase [Nakamurella endophytica]|uniref:Bifunctional RNase H/acid phosphatase n=1 Tax=Nakamurella endophytica TaxID=1748367 RepID=A0A917TCN4_9ACTN|nr:bifunctional RNase H/acid phosphatase [Nakamurella endophytica]GGM17789.1 bifunctional RNase H/acid phosphatase [Nakamurella endophytica]
MSPERTTADAGQLPLSDQDDGAGSGVTAVTLYADGGSRGNPGPAGYGTVVFDADGTTVLAERAASLGRATNNVAEYSGLIAGLEAAAELGAHTVAVRMDSKLVVEQMSGRWQVKHPDMKPLARRASHLVGLFDDVTFDWVPRARNAHADRLANEAMDAAAQGRTWVRSTGPTDDVPDAADAAGAAVPDGRDAAGDTSVGPGAGATAHAAGRTDTETAGTTDGASTTGRRSDPAAGRPERAAVSDTVVLVVRHGETTWSVRGRFAGREDVPLTANGVRQAHAVAARIAALQPDLVLTSPLQRCRATADAVARVRGIPVEPVDALLDGALGEWTGLTVGQIEAGWPEQFARWRSDVAATPPGGESFIQIRDRVRTVQERIRARHSGRVVVLVTHAAVAKMVVTEALGVPPDVAYRLRVDTGSLSGYSVDPDGATTVWAVNEAGHLPG